MESSREEDPFKSPSTTPKASPIYTSESPKKVWALRLFLLAVCLILAISVLYVVVIAAKFSLSVLILAIVNMLLSGLVGLLLVYWYRTDVLSGNKLLYLVVIGILISIQCITIDIFVGHIHNQANIELPTYLPTNATPHTHNATHHATTTPPALVR